MQARHRRSQQFEHVLHDRGSAGTGMSLQQTSDELSVDRFNLGLKAGSGWSSARGSMFTSRRPMARGLTWTSGGLPKIPMSGFAATVSFYEPISYLAK